LGNIVAGIFTRDFLVMIGIVILLLAVPAHIVFFLERRPNGGLVTHRSYFPGIFESAWWAAATLATQADQMPKSAAARVAAIIWMFTSVVFIAYFTAGITSSLTLQQLRGDIKGPEDLPGKRVATVSGSTSRNTAQHNVEVVIAKVEEAYQSHQQPAAVAYDSVLLYYASPRARARFRSSARSFAGKTGIALQTAALRVNEALLKLRKTAPTISFTRNGSAAMGRKSIESCLGVESSSKTPESRPTKRGLTIQGCLARYRGKIGGGSLYAIQWPHDH
jgi:polar amino acid transport system substrate-binding protein